MATFGSDGPGSASNGAAPTQVNYGTDDTSAHSAVSNVQMAAPQEVNPAYKGNLGRKAALMGNWRNPVGAQGTFFTQDDGAQIELPHSDPGSNFALNKEY